MTGSGSNSRSLVVLGFFLFALSLEAQTPRSVPPNFDPNFWGRPHKPYVATIVQTSETIDTRGVRQEHIIRTKYYRDDAGRERSEAFYDSGQLSAAMLRDPITTKVIMLYAVQRTANVFSVPRPAFPPPGRGWSVESLPSKTILGLLL
jgi:hypothetical protein